MSGPRLAPKEGETLDSIGPVRLLQRRDGYRFTLDAVLLAGFALKGSAPRRVVDLGAGCGVVGLLLAKWAPIDEMALIEIQPSLASLARRNAALNGSDGTTVVEADLRRLPESIPEASWDLVVTNPPWYEAGRFRLNPDSEKAIARHEVQCTLADIALSARRLLQHDGRLAAVLPVQRLGHWYAALDSASLHVSRLRFVHPRAGADANVVLAEATPARGLVSVESPLIVHGEDGGWTDEVAGVLGEGSNRAGNPSGNGIRMGSG